MRPDLEVIWPLHRWHYLNPSLNEVETDMTDDVTTDPTPVSSTGRDLAARALLAGAGCTHQRTGALLETSRRSVGRAADTDLGAALQDADVVAEARTVLADSARRGSTAEERKAAEAWLVQGVRDDGSIEATTRRSTGRLRKKPAPKAGVRAINGTPPAAAFPMPQIDALERQQQRILHRTKVIDYVLAAEQRNGATLTLGDALAELLQDISEAARTIGTILHDMGAALPPHSLRTDARLSVAVVGVRRGHRGQGGRSVMTTQPS